MLSNKTQELFGNSAVMLSKKKSVSWSFSKELRFKHKKKSIDIAYVALPSTLSPKGTVMGNGRRWASTKSRKEDSPSPDAYNLPSTLDRRGPRIVRESSLPPLNQKFMTPGPGTYNVKPVIGTDTPRFTFHGYDIRKKNSETPAPGHYSPSTVYLETSGFKAITFGIGERMFNRKKPNDAPGPGAYDTRSIFDKFKSK